eukprot:Seg7227.3 transcript_id=Seg7227.3/GoldUCD/mRNA.D3Y31 product="hypothetical protein" protein_id=Seg7227.3/GoldUCD/D3Y31
MSDRCDVMKKFNDLFDEFREKYLKDSDLTDDERKSWQALQHHFCFLHIVINLGDDACQRGLIDFDKCTLEEDVYSQFHKGGNSTTYKLIYSSSRLLHQQGSEKFGRSDLFEA